MLSPGSTSGGAVEPLAGKVVLITGAARGIGAETARRVAARGARVALLGLEPAGLAAVAAETGGAAFPCDVTDQRALEEAVAGAVETFGGLDVVVANAGVAGVGTVRTAPVEALIRTVEVNVGGVIRTVSVTLPHVLDRRGYLLLVSSTAAFAVLPGLSAYCASKAAVEQFGNALRLEVEHLGVAVGTAHMAWVGTDMVRDFSADLTGFAEVLRVMRGPLGRITSVRECADAFVAGIAGRRRRVYVPRSVGLMQAARSLVLSPLGDAIMRRRVREGVPVLERDLRTLGRNFGAHSTESSD